MIAAEPPPVRGHLDLARRFCAGVAVFLASAVTVYGLGVGAELAGAYRAAEQLAGGHAVITTGRCVP